MDIYYMYVLCSERDAATAAAAAAATFLETSCRTIPVGLIFHFLTEPSSTTNPEGPFDGGTNKVIAGLH